MAVARTAPRVALMSLSSLDEFRRSTACPSAPSTQVEGIWLASASGSASVVVGLAKRPGWSARRSGRLPLDEAQVLLGHPADVRGRLRRHVLRGPGHARSEAGAAPSADQPRQALTLTLPGPRRRMLGAMAARSRRPRTERR